MGDGIVLYGSHDGDEQVTAEAIQRQVCSLVCTVYSVCTLCVLCAYSPLMSHSLSHCLTLRRRTRRQSDTKKGRGDRKGTAAAGSGSGGASGLDGLRSLPNRNGAAGGGSFLGDGIDPSDSVSEMGAPIEEPVGPGGSVLLRNHPSYREYFRMAQLGIAPTLIQQQMAGVRLDYAVLSLDPDMMVDPDVPVDVPGESF